MKVQLSYGAFTQTMSIHIDDQPLSHVSRLTKYQSRPFETWCEEICDAIADEVNGKYDLSYMGRSCEARILGQFARSNVHCGNFISETPPLPESAAIRLKRLSSFVQSGLKCQRFSSNIYLYTDGNPDEINSIISKGVPKLSFCRIRLQVHTLDDLANHPADIPAYILLVNDFAISNLPLAVLQTSRVAIICADNRFVPLRMINGFFEEHIPLQNCLTILDQYFELWSYADVLAEAIKEITISENDPSYLQVLALDKQEPMTQVVLPSSIEYGETEPIKIRTIPTGFNAEDIGYRISDETVIQHTPQGLKAVGVGEAVVEAYKAGQSVKVASQRITCYRRNRIQSISIKTPQIEMLVGDRYSLLYDYEPSDADDANKIRIVSSNGTIVAPDGGGFIRARAPGNCTISVQAERSSAPCSVRVYPRVSKIIPSVQSIETAVGEVVKLNAECSPAGATLQKIVYSVSPPSLGRYDSGVKGFYAQNPGNGELIVSTQDGSVKKTIPVCVKPARKPVTMNWKLIAIAVATIIILYFILKGA